MFGVINILSKLAPIGAFGAMAFTVGRYGIASLGPLCKVDLACVLYHLLTGFVLVILGLMGWASGFQHRQISNLRLKKRSWWILATSSSETALPTLMEKMEKLGCSKPLVGLVVPTGYTFNTDGSSMYMTMAALFVAQATKHSPDDGPAAVDDFRGSCTDFQRSERRDRSGIPGIALVAIH